ncbi:MAG: fibronectin type III domain-containing protein, partial [Cyclobacteriaceae bacterium]
PADVVTFQVILFPDGSIKLQYETVEGTVSSESSTVGVEGPDGTNGLQVLFNTPFLTDGLAITITPPITGVLAPGESTELTVILDATDLEEGVYEDNILIESNDPANPEVTVPVTLNVTPSCSAPENLVISEVTNTTAQFDWDNSNNALEYEFRYRPVGSSWTSVFTETNSLALTELTEGTEYQVRVRSICSEDGMLKSGFSSSQKFTTTGELACQAPADLEVLNITETEAEVNWDAGAGAVKYNVFYKYSKTPWQKMFVTDLGVSLTDLFPGTTYKIKVRSICSENNAIKSQFSETVSFTTSGAVACETPGTPELIDLSSTTASLAWDDANGAISYELSYVKSGVPWTSVVINDTNFTITGLEPGTKYRARVRTLCSEDGRFRSDYSGKVKFTTPSSSSSTANARLANMEEPPTVFESSQLNIYPNPSTGVVHMKMGLLQGERVSIKVFNLHGALITAREVEGQLNESFDFSSLAKGVYMTHVSSNTGRKILHRLIIQ